MVRVRPELVVEIAFNDVQKSPHYPGGVALRFARVKGYRPDKSAQEVDTLDSVHEIYQTGFTRPVRSMLTYIINSYGPPRSSAFL